MRKKRSAQFLLQSAATILILMSVVLFGIELAAFSRLRSALPLELKVAGVSVGGLTPEQAANRINQMYSLPVNLQVENSTFQLSPNVAGFDLDMEGMLAAADLQRVNTPFWSAFWDYLWGRYTKPTNVPLRAELSEDQLTQYLQNEVAPRYNADPISVIDMSGSGNFLPGTPGRELDIDASVTAIKNALFSINDRTAELAFNETKVPRPTKAYLQSLITRMIEIEGFEGIMELYLLDLTTRDELHFAIDDGEPINPDIAFTAASTMKIPIMVSTFIDRDLPLTDNVNADLEFMIEQSENTSTDRLMERLDGNFGPLTITENLQKLGLENSFIAGFYYFGAPLLQLFETTANSRLDVNVNPDVYNQTTASEIGMLLDDIYQCANYGGGTLIALYPDQITQGECQQMLAYLSANRIGVLTEAGLPDGTKIAHKHGWITESDGLIHTISDVGIVYSPSANYVICLFLWHPNQLVFDEANLLFADISRAIYNYFNIEN
jgi:beta-lactamase class A